jgi:hypothetical protein
MTVVILRKVLPSLARTSCSRELCLISSIHEYLPGIFNSPCRTHVFAVFEISVSTDGQEDVLDRPSCSAHDTFLF